MCLGKNRKGEVKFFHPRSVPRVYLAEGSFWNIQLAGFLPRTALLGSSLIGLANAVVSQVDLAGTMPMIFPFLSQRNKKLQDWITGFIVYRLNSTLSRSARYTSVLELHTRPCG